MGSVVVESDRLTIKGSVGSSYDGLKDQEEFTANRWFIRSVKTRSAMRSKATHQEQLKVETRNKIR